MPSSWAVAPLTGMETAGAARVVALTRLGVAQIMEPAMLAQEGDVVWVAVDGDRIDSFDRHLAAGPTAIGGH